MKPINVIKLSSKLKSITQVEPFANELRLKYNIDDEVFHNILISLTEAVNNAIIHGNQVDENKEVVLQTFLEQNRLTVCVRDEGGGFEVAKVPDPCCKENIEKPGGRGVLIMKSLSDDIHFKNNGSCVEMIFNIRK
ncbi:MAG: ATP-binding protein [Saprospiraceae bacterium]|jgi:serine/threonine-protein kinase RsbW|nr:ATP-binding protein [Saprospiraceae bacterium]MCA0333413.1 ATP-binding protein [Bacteroidota bacterium]MCB0605124.1 ATP-binding protein [Saprospiraceae bacterium]MCO5277555.1 ATP-binding protein [Saprospiraceae bacterium]HMT76510.1 ATP-binding protein [Saprospiraceae bacterium]